MAFPPLTFPLTVDFGNTKYWIGDHEPFRFGEAVTAFFTGEEFAEPGEDRENLMRDLELYLKVFGNYLQPYIELGEITDEMSKQLSASSATCTVNYDYHIRPGSAVLVERYTFPALRDFLYVDLGKAIMHGNGPRQCRLCGQWFFHEQGGRSLYCERVAPGETERTCRLMGARAVFEKKIQDEDTWKLYKRAYKKYYARYMKGNMSEEAFKTWAAQAARERDAAIEQVKAALDENLKAQVIERLREELNRK